MFMRQQQAVKGKPNESSEETASKENMVDDDVMLRSLMLSSAAYAANGSLGVALLGGLVGSPSPLQ